MARVEFEGKDLEEAIAKAAAALNMPPEKVKFSVSSMGTKGFLGLGRRKARISVDPDDPVLALEGDPADDRRRKEAPRSKPVPPQKEPGGRPEEGGEAKRPDERTQRPTVGQQSRPSPDRGPGLERPKPPAGKKAERPPKEPPRKRDAKKHEEAVSSRQAQPGREHRPDKKDGLRERPAPEALPLDWSHVPPALTKPGPGETLAEATADQACELALGVAGEILTRMGFEAEISVARIDSRILLSLESPDNALLIGARGGTLEALQLLVNKIAARRLAEANPETPADCRVVLDVADYRARRREMLLENLKSLSEQVRRTRKPQAMPGLNSDERRLIQLALRPFKDLYIISSGGREALTISPHPPRRKAPGGRR